MKGITDYPASSFALCCMALLWALTLAPKAHAQPGADYTDDLLAGAEASELGGDLPTKAICLPTGTPDAEAARMGCILQIVVDSNALPATGAGLSIKIQVALSEGEAERHQRQVRTGPLARASSWVYLVPLEIPNGARGIALAVEEEETGLWGGCLVELASEPIAVADNAVLTESAEPLGVRLTPSVTTEAPISSIIRLVPPRGAEHSGGTRFDTLVSTDEVDRVEFYLDGVKIEQDRFKPFAARLELKRPPQRQEVRVVAYDEGNRELGQDTLLVNGGDGTFRVAVSELRGDPALGSIEVEAAVQLPLDAVLDRVEFYFNDQLAHSLAQPPFLAKVPTPTAGPADFVRVAAFLKDGSSIDTVELLAARGATDNVDVNLVELFVVVNDGDGQPLSGLPQEKFEIVRRGQHQDIEGFRFAQDIPLLLGLVIDSSGSMEGMMQQTKQAAGGFLAKTMQKGDRAFLVDFDSQPRLAHPVTSDLRALSRGFRSMKPEGFTAFFDSVIFSLLQFGKGRGRKALVVLTDGDDYGSRFSPSRAIKDSRESGVPVYIIGLGEHKQLLRAYKQNDLKEVAAKTGGKVFLVSNPNELAAAYAQINAELRSQYLLTFYAKPDGKPLEVEVKVDLPGATTRTVVGGR
ncbi:MAG: VWA domain-containing protein [Deltaproteobacteria bacterium]|nr:VWA domain-containing protein [Deltaproteobacteria bacterium]